MYFFIKFYFKMLGFNKLNIKYFFIIVFQIFVLMIKLLTILYLQINLLYFLKIINNKGFLLHINFI